MSDEVILIIAIITNQVKRGGRIEIFCLPERIFQVNAVAAVNKNNGNTHEAITE